MKEYIPSRVHFRFNRGTDNWPSERIKIWSWLEQQVGPEDEVWSWMATPMMIDNQKYDGFFLFEDENHAMMFKMVFA